MFDPVYYIAFKIRPFADALHSSKKLGNLVNLTISGKGVKFCE